MRPHSVLLLLLVAIAVGCGGESTPPSNNGTTATNNTTGATNNTTGATNNTTSETNSGTTSGTTNTTGDVDYIVADVDGVTVLADAPEGGVEPMGATVQLRKTTAESGGASILIYRISIPNTDPASYSCAADDVTVTYSKLDGQLINNWVATDTCAIEITQGGAGAGDKVVGTFSASATDGATTLELTNGEFSLTR